MDLCKAVLALIGSLFLIVILSHLLWGEIKRRKEEYAGRSNDNIPGMDREHDVQ